MLSQMIKNKIEGIYRGYTQKHIHYVEGKKVSKKSFYKVRSWPKHPRMDKFRDLVYRFVELLVKGLKKIQGRL